MSTPRRNEVDTIAGIRAAGRIVGAGAVLLELAPSTIAFLQIPLTPSRAAALAAFTARHDIGAQAMVLDLLDDVIFAEVVSEGGVSCTEHYAGRSRKPAKSSARSCGEMHDCAARRSDEPAKASGRTKRRRSSRLALAAQYARPPTSLPASASHPDDQLPPSSPRSASGHSDE